jgi:hypothetical protein
MVYSSARRTHSITVLQTGADDDFTSFQRDDDKDVEQIVFMHPDSIASYKRTARRKLHAFRLACPPSDSTPTFIIRWIFDYTYKVLAAKVSIPWQLSVCNPLLPPTSQKSIKVQNEQKNDPLLGNSCKIRHY